MGAALLDLNEPSKVLYRCKYPLLSPEKIYETAGYVGNVVFPTGVVADGETGRLAIYYGAADTYTAVAYAQVDEIIAYIKENAW
jgi:beta-1,4-mannooligosaccharide/beta-1,4-mannosyl-N-acetylglucosamine phosphorylase